MLIAVGVLARPLRAVMIVIFVTGSALIHWKLRFFIVGPGEGGWEFSALLIACFFAVALDDGPGRRPAAGAISPTALPGSP